MSSKLLSIYLNDHLAAAHAGVELARRTLKSNPDGSLGEVLRQLVSEMEKQTEVLEEVMSRTDTRPSTLKVALARLAERFGRLKLNGRLRGYSPLSRVVELEGLNLVTQLRLMLWRTLAETLEADALEEIDLEYLQAQTLAQVENIDRELYRAAKEALIPN